MECFYPWTQLSPFLTVRFGVDASLMQFVDCSFAPSLSVDVAYAVYFERGDAVGRIASAKVGIIFFSPASDVCV